MTDESPPGGDRYEYRYEDFPDGFFTRLDQDDDRRFYHQPRLVQHTDDGAIAVVRDLYDELWPVRPGARPVQPLGVTSCPDPATVGRARDERPRTRTQPAGSRMGRPRPQPRARAAVHRCRHRRGDVHGVGRLPGPAPRGVRRDSPLLRPDAPFVCTFSNRRRVGPPFPTA